MPVRVFTPLEILAVIPWLLTSYLWIGLVLDRGLFPFEPIGSCASGNYEFHMGLLQDTIRDGYIWNFRVLCIYFQSLFSKPLQPYNNYNYNYNIQHTTFNT